ncbi:MAG: low temperature requirement protein A [Acidimicrobiales bacterium]
MSEGGRPHRLHAVLRDGERVTPLELFFDLVFVLAITQCTARMAHEPTWTGLGKALLVLAVLWWAWSGYAWLTSVVDPEEGAVRFVIFAAMAAFLVVALCVPEAFEDLGLTFAVAYGGVRAMHLALFALASRGDPELRGSVTALAISSAIAIGLLAAASYADGSAQGALWGVALLLDVGGPFIFRAGGWRLVPKHFAERFGLIFLIALGESIVAIGVGAGEHVDGGVILAAVLGIALAAAMWWAYFDVVALVAERRLSAAAVGEEQNRMARDSYSLLHFPMVAGVVLIALGLKTTLADVGEPLDEVPAFSLVGGLAIYLLAHVGFRLRNVRTLNKQRLLVAAVLLAAVPMADQPDALVTLAAATALLWAMIGYEATRFAAGRDQVRHEAAAQPPS